MITTPQLYYELKLLLNKSGTATNAEVTRPVFVTLYNREAERWLAQSLTKKADNQDFEDLQELLVIDAELEKTDSSDQYTTFGLPADWFQLEGVRPLAQAGCRKTLVARPVKSRNIPEVLADPLNNPSFEWGETIYALGQNRLHVYQDGFTVPGLRLTYYRHPRKIDIEGYSNFENKPSTTIDPDLESVYCRQILDRVALELTRQFEYLEGHQLSKDRIITQEREQF